MVIYEGPLGDGPPLSEESATKEAEEAVRISGSMEEPRDVPEESPPLESKEELESSSTPTEPDPAGAENSATDDPHKANNDS